MERYSPFSESDIGKFQTRHAPVTHRHAGRHDTMPLACNSSSLHAFMCGFSREIKKWLNVK